MVLMTLSYTIYHTNEEGHVWLDVKNSPILLTQPLVGHTGSKDPHELWH